MLHMYAPYSLTLLVGGGCSTPPTVKQPKDPQNGLQAPPNFSYFYMTYLISKKEFLVFHSDLGCLEGGVANTPPHLTYIFDPDTNRVK